LKFGETDFWANEDKSKATQPIPRFGIPYWNFTNFIKLITVSLLKRISEITIIFDPCLVVF